MSALVVAYFVEREQFLRHDLATGFEHRTVFVGFNVLLEIALRDPDRKISETALDSLGQIGGPVAIRLLLDMLGTSDPLLREAAADNLEELSGML